jgi:hypothetical protein
LDARGAGRIPVTREERLFHAARLALIVTAVMSSCCGPLRLKARTVW